MQYLENTVIKLIQKKRDSGEFTMLTPENSLQMIIDFFTNLQNNNCITSNPKDFNHNGEVIFLEAPTGSGKDNLLLQLSKQNPEKNYIELNMDMFRKHYKLFISNNKALNDIDFAKLTNQFSYEIFLLIQEILLNYFPGTNVIISGTLRETDWIEDLMKNYKSNKNTKYTLKLITLTISKEEGIYSVIKRYVNIVDRKRKSSNFMSGTARYTSSEYYNETFEKFISNFEYFVNIFKNSPGGLIDSIEIYRRNRSLIDFNDDNLVYSSNREKDKNKNPLSVIQTLRNQAYQVPLDDAIETLYTVKENLTYLKKQNTLIDILYTLSSLLNYKVTDTNKSKRKLSDFEPTI